MPAVKLIESRDSAVLLPFLRDAEEGDARIAQVIEDSANSAYLALNGDSRVGAMIVRWMSGHESEIIYMATVAVLRGQGYGKAVMQAILDEARQRSVESICVGTANSSLSNIAFYQKCGFRIDSVRKNYFDYFSAAVYENGIQIRDMLVLRFVLRDPEKY